MGIDSLGRKWPVVKLQGIPEAPGVVQQPEHWTGPGNDRENQGVPDAGFPGLTPRKQHKQGREGQHVPFIVTGERPKKRCPRCAQQSSKSARFPVAEEFVHDQNRPEDGQGFRQWGACKIEKVGAEQNSGERKDACRPAPIDSRSQPIKEPSGARKSRG